MSGQVERDYEGCEEVMCVLGWNMSVGMWEIAGDNEER